MQPKKVVPLKVSVCIVIGSQSLDTGVVVEKGSKRELSMKEVESSVATWLKDHTTRLEHAVFLLPTPAECDEEFVDHMLADAVYGNQDSASELFPGKKRSFLLHCTLGSRYQAIRSKICYLRREATFIGDSVRGFQLPEVFRFVHTQKLCFRVMSVETSTTGDRQHQSRSYKLICRAVGGAFARCFNGTWSFDNDAYTISLPKGWVLLDQGKHNNDKFVKLNRSVEDHALFVEATFRTREWCVLKGRMKDCAPYWGLEKDSEATSHVAQRFSRIWLGQELVTDPNPEAAVMIDTKVINQTQSMVQEKVGYQKPNDSAQGKGLSGSTLIPKRRHLIHDPLKMVLVPEKSRLGQAKWKQQLVKRWGERCFATGSKIAVQGAHIINWASATDEQRLDPKNGLLLTASVHFAFDNGQLELIDCVSHYEILLHEDVRDDPLLGFLNGRKLGCNDDEAQAIRKFTIEYFSEALKSLE